MPQSKRKTRLSSPPSNASPGFFTSLLLFLFGFFLPTQFGKHFFLPFSYLSGIRIDYLAPTLYFTDILVALLLIAHLRQYRQILRNTWVQLFLLVSAVGLFFAVSRELSLYHYIKIIELFVVFAVLRHYRSHPQMFLFGLLNGTVVQFILAFAQFVRRESLDGIFYFLGERKFSLSTPGIAKTAMQGAEFLRPYGTFSHPNSMGGFYLAIYAYLLFQSKKSLSALLHWLFIVLSSFLIFLSFSKIAIFGFFLINLKYIIVNWKRYRDCLVCTGARILAALLLVGIVASSSGDPLSGQKRIELMLNSFAIISQNFITGVGLGNYLIAQNAFPSQYPGFIGQPVHNIFLLLLSEVGIIIFAGVLGACAWFLKRRRHNYLVSAVFFVIFLTGMFDHYWLTLQQNWLLGAVLIALL